MKRQLKKWNGRGQGKYQGYHFYVAAYSQKQAGELIIRAGGGWSSGVHEIRNYYFACWGTPMDGIEPTEPGVWVQERYGKKKPTKIL